MPAGWYEIRVEGELPRDWSNWFEGMDIKTGPPGQSVLSGRLDQAALHGVLAKIRDLNLMLISVARGRPATLDSDKELNGENDKDSSRRGVVG